MPTDRRRRSKARGKREVEKAKTIRKSKAASALQAEADLVTTRAVPAPKKRSDKPKEKFYTVRLSGHQKYLITGHLERVGSARTPDETELYRYLMGVREDND